MDYSSQVLRRFRSPLRAGALAAEMPGTVRGEAEDRSRNIWGRFHVHAPGSRIRAVRFEIFVCGREGLAPSALTAGDVPAAARALGVPTEKLGKLLRIEDALLACWQELERNGRVVDGQR